MLLTRLIYPFGLKAFPPAMIRNDFCRSGVKSQLRGPVNPNKIRRATATMISFTKLKRNVGFTLGGGRNITGNGSPLTWVLFRIYENPWIKVKRNSNKEIISQRSKVAHDAKVRTMGNPKRRKPQGFGSSVVEQLFLRRELGIQKFYMTSRINHTRGTTPKSRIDFKNDGITRVIHDIATLKNMTMAYKSIKGKSEDTTSGVESIILDCNCLVWVKKTIVDLRSGKYLFAIKRKLANLKMDSDEYSEFLIFRNKVILIAILQVLESIYEKKFRDNLHGFNLNKDRYTALSHTKQQFNDIFWIIEKNIAKCFDSIDHKILLKILGRKIKCNKTNTLIKRSLKFSFVNQKMTVKLEKEIFKFSPLSPLVLNIYFHEINRFIKSLHKFYRTDFHKSKLLKYCKAQHKLIKLNTSTVEKKRLKIKLRRLNSRDYQNLNFRRLAHVKCVDDFIIGVIGQRKDCNKFCEEIKNFLIKNLALESSMKKTVISYFNHNGIKFFETNIREDPKKKEVNRKILKKSRTIFRARVGAPVKFLLDKEMTNGIFKRLQNGKVAPTALRKMVNLNHSAIIKLFNDKIKSILNSYSFVDNLKSLGRLIHSIRHSCALTLALKYKLRLKSKVFGKFGKYLECRKTGMNLFMFNSFFRKRIFYVNPSLLNVVMGIR
jgi:retron-type reverse transcriptase